MRRLAALLVMIGAGTATADDTGDLTPTRVRAKLAGTVARLDVRFELDVKGPAFDPGVPRMFELPMSGVITAATVREGRRVVPLRLERTPAVDKLFSDLVEKPGTGTERTWAVRIDVDSRQAQVDIAAPRDAHLVLDVSVEVPTCFADDARHIQVPDGWFKTARQAPDIDELCGEGSGGAWYSFASRELTQRPSGADRVGVRASRLPLGAGHIARVEIDVAAELAEVPRDLYTAIVVDHSRSLRPDEIETQRAVVAAYLRAAPNGRVQVIGYARDARPLLPSWMVARHAAARIDREVRSLPPRNGSNVDTALAAAGDWLTRVKGTRRVILFTDDRLAERLHENPRALAQVLPASTLVHAITVRHAVTALDRDDDTALAELARATEGMTLRSTVRDGTPPIDATPLVRPVRIDKLQIDGLGWERSMTDQRQCPSEEALDEGRSCVWWADGGASAGPLTITGWIWGTKLTRIVRPDPAQARAVARVLTTFDALPQELRSAVDQAALVVNTMWSLVATWGSSGGYADLQEFGALGFGRAGMGGCCGHGTSSTGVTHTIGGIHLRSELERQLTGAVRGCRPEGIVNVTIETTLDEIVDVRVTSSDVDSVRLCITEAVWEASLVLPHAPEHATTSFAVQPD